MSKNLAPAQHAVALAILAAVGREVLATEEGNTHTLKITGISPDQVGSMKDKSKAPYAVLTRDGEDGGEAIVVALHPKNASALLEKGEDGIYKLVAAEGTTEAVSTSAAAEPTTTEASAEGTAEGNAEATVEAKDNVPTKKEMAIDAYITLANDGKTRAEIIKHFVDVIGLSKAGAATYYQNCHSNKAGWTEALETSSDAAGTENDAEADAS
jgi:hypothetical protein